MVDRSAKGSEFEDSISRTPEEKSVKSCADCGTTKTPLWRGGPAGPKSLCNACGIKSRKKRRAILGLNRGEDKKSKRSDNNSKFGDSLKRKLMEVVREMGSNKRSMVGKQKMWRKLGEEEQAAVLLMALSCGSVYA